jgi:hypothetical protein
VVNSSVAGTWTNGGQIRHAPPEGQRSQLSRFPGRSQARPVPWSSSFFPQPTEEQVTVGSRHRRTVAIGAVVALAAAGGGVAYAAATNTDPRDAVLRDAAQRLNVTPGGLRSALQGAFGDQLDQAVKDGKLTQQQADQIKQRIARYGVPLGGPLGPEGPGHGFRLGFSDPGHGPFGAGLDAAASYLGLTSAQLDRQLRSGRTLAEIARTQGRSVDGLRQALLDAAKTELDRAVADRTLTSDERDRILSELSEHVGDLVNGSAPGPRLASGRHDWRGDRGMGPLGPGGPGAPGGPPPGGFRGP